MMENYVVNLMLSYDKGVLLNNYYDSADFTSKGIPPSIATDKLDGISGELSSILQSRVRGFKRRK
jgi:hypothetical protein